MNKLINIVLSGLLWRRYKFLLVSLILLIVFVFLVGQVHQDYLAYAQSTGGVAVGWSFAVKWLVWILGIVVFLALNHWANQRKQKQNDAQDKNSALQRIIKWKNKSQEKTGEAKLSDKAPDKSPNKGEQKGPFAALREKEKLRTYADIIIEKKSKE